MLGATISHPTFYSTLNHTSWEKGQEVKR